VTPRTLALIVPLLATAAPYLAQQRFRTTTDGVRIDVLVTDGRRPIAGLQEKDFILLDQGVRQDIDTIAIEDIPLSMMLALDISASVEGHKLRALVDGVQAAASALGPRDRSALLTFSEEVSLRTSWSSGGAAIVKALPGLAAGGATALVDAGFAALTLRDDLPDRRHLVIVFTDGDDTSSWLSWQALLDRAQRTDAVVYGVTQKSWQTARPRSMPLMVFAQGDGEPPTDVLEALAEVTGGRVFAARDPDDLRSAFTGIVREFRSRYVLTYTPKNVEATGWHPIEVKLKDRKATIKARRGYTR
jgi:Ca-activated chloride channel family protein